MSSTERALVLFSGGQDSTTCLAWALTQFEQVETIGFHYGQRHVVEMSVRSTVREKLRGLSAEWDQKLGEDHLVDLSFVSSLSENAMTKEIPIKMLENGVPNTFVPGRNLLFTMVAATLAYQRGLTVLIGGMCQAEYSGYPDCRDDSIKALQVALNLGMASNFRIETPLMWRDKAQTWVLAEDLGGEALVNMIREETHTCYVGERETLHDWGYGCGECPACQLRASGYRRYLGMAK